MTFERNVGAQVALVKSTEYCTPCRRSRIVEGAATALRAPSSDRRRTSRGRARSTPDARPSTTSTRTAFTELNREFHAVLFEHCPNPHVLDLVHRGWTRLADAARLLVQLRAGPRPRVRRRARPLLELIESGADPLEIELAARRHRTATLDAVLAHQFRSTGSRRDGCRQPTHPPPPATCRPTTRRRTRHHADDPDESTHMTHHIPPGLPDRIRTTSTASSSTPSAARRSTCSTRCRTRPTSAAAGQKADVDLAVAAARRAFTDGPWPRMKPRDAPAHPEPDRRRGRGAGRPPRRARDLRHRPAHHPGARARRSAPPRTSASSPT